MKVTRYYASTGQGVNVKKIIQELLNIELEYQVNTQKANEDFALADTDENESRDVV